jgi:alkylated DNA repair dioxygenase AlkB
MNLSQPVGVHPVPADFAGRSATLYALDHGAELVFVPGFLTEVEKERLLDESQKYPWARQPVMGVLTLRSNAWFAEDPRAVYKYSGQSWTPEPLTPQQVEVRDRLTAALGERMDSVLATHYPHGGAAVGYHADDEPIFGENPTLASFSIGASRVFQVAEKSRAGKGAADLEVVVSDGDLVVMRGPFQHHYRHAVKKASKSVGPRLNLSYRRVVFSATAR